MTNQFSFPILAVLSGFIAGSVGCGTKTNPYYCPGRNPDDNCTEPVICKDNSPCAAPTGVCDTNMMACVQCTPAMASACTGTSPICGTDDSCHGCAAHSDCSASNVCLPDGSCAQPDSVAYVAAAPSGTDNPMCSLTTPCTRVAAALATGRPYVKFHGVIDEAVLVNGGRSVTFLGDPGAELTRSVGSGAIVTVQDDRTSLSIYDLSISNAPNSASGIGCLIPTGAGAPTLSLTRVSIMNNPGGGISSSLGAVTVAQSTIGGNQGAGISNSGGSLAVAQSTISGNQGGGISSSNGTFIIVGNVFFSNGGPTSSVGGVSITTATSSMNRLEFNSFNQNQTGAPIGQAIQCFVTSFTAKNNIMSDNGTLTQMDQVGGSCSHVYSIGRPGTLLTGTGNSSSNPLFVDPTKGNLHLQSTSPARRAADPGSDLTGIASHDIDENVRVTPADIGAYQFK
jgi:hypothetical protein